MPQRARPASFSLFSGIVALALGVTAPAQAATSVWELVYQVEAAVPWNEGKLARSLAIPLQRAGESFRSGPVKVEDGKTVESVTFTPKRGNRAATVELRMPPAPSRTENCLGRGDVSREYGAPARNWTSQEGQAALSHFEFARPNNGRIRVAFSDATNCLTVLTVEEPA